MIPADARDAATTAALIDELYGDPLEAPVGLLHVVATFRDGNDLRVLKIGDAAPKSAFDFFALNLARARAEAILTSGAVLRAEPELSCDLQGEAAAGLRAWRRERAGLQEPPLVVVLSTGRALPNEHPIWSSPRCAVLAPDTAVEALRAALPSSVEILGDPAPSPRRAIERLRARGLRTISIEAGPSVARAFYEEPPIVDELMLSIVEGDVREEARGPTLVPIAAIEGALVRVARSTRDAWELSRWISPSRRGSAAGSRSPSAGSA